VRLSFAPVVKKARPAVVNVYASRVETMPRNPLFDDPIFRQFFGGAGKRGTRAPRNRWAPASSSTRAALSSPIIT
jgi:S1-C subfamily serine protease